MSRCKKINDVSGVAAKVMKEDDGSLTAVFTYMTEGEPQARVKMNQAQFSQFFALMNRVSQIMCQPTEDSEYKIIL